MSSAKPHRNEAVCEAESAYRALVRMVLWLDAADLEVSEAISGVIESVGVLATGLAADHGPVEVERRAFDIADNKADLAAIAARLGVAR